MKLRGFLCGVVGLLCGCSAADTPAGRWQATVALDPQDSVRVVMDLEKTAARWIGAYDVEAYGMEDYPVTVSTSGKDVTLFFSGPNAEFKGALKGKTMTGELTHGTGHVIPVTFHRAGDPEFSQDFLRIELAADDSSLVEELAPDAGALAARFNADRDKTRLLMLLSPT